MLRNNLILKSDSYKYSHTHLYPPGTTAMESYGCSRGGKYPAITFFGMQYLIKEYFSKKISVADVEEANEVLTKHGVPFDRDGWTYIAKDLGGKLPMKIRAVKEGTTVPNHNILWKAESTDPRVFWLESWAETKLVQLWYPCTTATKSREIKKVIMKYLQLSSDDPAGEILFKLHSFGYRGVTSDEQAGIGDMAHLINFMGTDTLPGVTFARDYYGEDLSGYSIPATEHSTITSWTRAGEAKAYSNFLDQFGGKYPLIACVSDSYDIYNAITNLWGGELKSKVVNCGSTLICRPDSGDPPTMVRDCLKLLDAAFGSVLNTKGYKVLNNVRVIQGDGVNQASIGEILELATNEGYSATNIAFGSGGDLLQSHNRDTNKFAVKCSSITVSGQDFEVTKDPITDQGKRSLGGSLDLIQDANGTYQTIKVRPGQVADGSLLQTVFENGELVNETTFAEIRARAAL